MSDGIDKRNGGDLWAEIKKLYEADAAPTFEKMKAILMAEFNLSSFPSQSTITRRAKAENWQRSAGSPTANLYDTAFWEVVRKVYESYAKISYSELRELVQNALQINYFPTQPAVSKRQKEEGWKPLEQAVNLDDESLKNLKNDVTASSHIIQKYIDQFTNKKGQVIENERDDYDDDDHGFSHFDYFSSKMNSNIQKKNKLLMSSSLAKLEQVEFIEYSRFRMAKMAEMGDELHDAMVKYYAAMSDPAFLSILDGHAYLIMERAGANLVRSTNIYSVLTGARSNVIKNEFLLRGLKVDDVRDDSNKEKYVPGEDAEEAAAFEAQRQRLAKEAKEAHEYRIYIESGQLEEDVEKEIAEATAHDDDDDDIVDAEYEDVEPN